MRRLSLPRGDVEIRVLTQPEEMEQVAQMQDIAWQGREAVVPPSFMVALAHEGGLILGAYTLQEPRELVGFVMGFLGLHETPEGRRIIKHCSHMMGVHPDWQNQGLGYWLKRAQWQWVRHQGLELITWTYDPLWSRNAHLNIRKLGGIVRTYYPNYYGPMTDALNRGLPSDRFLVELWVNTPRVRDRMESQPRKPLDLAHFLAAEVRILNPAVLNDQGLPVPPETFDEPDPETEPFVLVEIPPDFFQIRAQDMDLAWRWRLHIRYVFQHLFDQGYLVTDFLHLKGPTPRSFYVVTYGESTLGV